MGLDAIMATMKPQRIFELVEQGDGLTWVTQESRAKQAPGATGKPTLAGGAASNVLLYREAAERRVERRKYVRPRPLDVTA